MQFNDRAEEPANRLLRLAVKSSSSPLLLLDNRARCVYLNEAAEQLTGYGLAEIEGRTLHEAIHHTRPDGTPYSPNNCPIQKGLEQGVRKTGIDYFVRKDGEFYPVEYTFTPLKHENETLGASVEMVATAAPLEEQRTAQVGGTEETEVYYHLLLNSMNQGFFVSEIILNDNGKAIDYRFIETNASFEKLTGLRNAKGKTARQLVPNLEPHWFDIYGKVAMTGEPVHVSEGSAAMGRWFDVYAFRIGGDESLRIAVLFTNVTERKRAEEERNKLLKALELERSRLETVFREAPAAIATLHGPDHVFEMANPFYHQLVDKRELIGRTAREVFPELRDQGIFELLDEVFNSGEPYVARGMHVPIRHDSDKQQRDYYLDFVYQPLREADGSVTGIFAHAVDVTEHKKAVEALARAHDVMEERVEERTAELKALNRELESFNYSVSHDLRAPLRAIDGFSQVILEEYADSLDDNGQKYLRRIKAASNRMGELIDDLLKLSQLTRSDMKPREFDLSKLAREVARDLAERETRKSTPTVEVAPEVTAVGDPAFIRIALENLLDNAMKFTQNRIDGHIEVGVKDEGQDKTYFVRDNGAGFSMSQSQKLFVPFQRLHSTEYPGSGVGLATVQRIVHMHGGQIWAESETDNGATFYFTLSPRKPRPNPEPVH